MRAWKKMRSVLSVHACVPDQGHFSSWCRNNAKKCSYGLIKNAPAVPSTYNRTDLEHTKSLFISAALNYAGRAYYIYEKWTKISVCVNARAREYYYIRLASFEELRNCGGATQRWKMKYKSTATRQESVDQSIITTGTTALCAGAARVEKRRLSHLITIIISSKVPRVKNSPEKRRRYLDQSIVSAVHFFSNHNVHARYIITKKQLSICMSCIMASWCSMLADIIVYHADAFFTQQALVLNIQINILYRSIIKMRWMPIESNYTLYLTSLFLRWNVFDCEYKCFNLHID